MTILRDLLLNIIASFAVSFFFMWGFQPDIFAKGISGIKWILYIKVIIGIAIIFTLINAIIYLKMTKLKEVLALNLIGDHFYTIDEKNRDEAIQLYGYNCEKIECYVFPESGKNIKDAVPLYRLFRPTRLKAKIDWAF